MTTDPPLDPAEMCETIGRLIFRGLPVPVSINPGSLIGPKVLVLERDLGEWIERTSATDGDWRRVGAYEHYRAHADGFDIVSNRPHVCEPVK